MEGPSKLIFVGKGKTSEEAVDNLKKDMKDKLMASIDKSFQIDKETQLVTYFPPRWPGSGGHCHCSCYGGAGAGAGGISIE